MMFDDGVAMPEIPFLPSPVHLPGASIKVVEGGDHLFPMTHPIETAVVLEEYLDWD